MLRLYCNGPKIHHIHPRLNITFTSRAQSWSVGTFQKSICFQKTGRID